MKYDAFEFEMPWRPNYEAYFVGIWLSGAVCYAIMGIYRLFPTGLMTWMTLLCVFFSITQLAPAIRLYYLHKRLAGHQTEFIQLQELQKICNDPKYKNMLWLGKGFQWGSREIQSLMQLGQHDEKDLVALVLREWKKRTFFKEWKKSGYKKPIEAYKKTKEIGVALAEDMGQPWIHGVGEKEVDQWQKIEHANGHSLLFGTTGAGKTRFFDLMISQAIMRGETVVIIDPKGDKDLEENARNACETLGRSDDFCYFHLGHPEKSIHLDPLTNWSNEEEIASRVSALLPQDPGSAPFTGFSWQAMNTIAKALILCTKRPTLTTIKHYLESGVTEFVALTIMAWMRDVYGEEKADAEVERIRSITGSNPYDFTKRMVYFYRQNKGVNASPVVDSLLSMYEHNSEHFSKMLSSLLPTLSKLTSGHLGQLLSRPDLKNDSTVTYSDFATLTKQHAVVYVGLDTMTSAEVGAAVGSMMLADLTAVAGDRYKFDQKNNGPVNIFIDEANEVANIPLIQLLNKSRGAGFRIFLATQTYSDFVARLGTKDYANQVLGNLNNLYAMRSNDPATQEFIISRMAKTKIKEIQRDQGGSTHSQEPIITGNTLRESLKMTEVDLFPSYYLGKLPGLEYIGVISGGYVVKGRIPILTR